MQASTSSASRTVLAGFLRLSLALLEQKTQYISARQYRVSESWLVSARRLSRRMRSSDSSGSEKERAWPSFVSALVAALGSLTIGYAMGYPSSALIDLAGLREGFDIQKGSVESELFAVSGPHSPSLI